MEHLHLTRTQAVVSCDLRHNSVIFEMPQRMRAVYLHHLPQLLQQLGLQNDIAAPTLQHCAASALVLLLPGALALAVDWASPLADLGMRASGADCALSQ